MIIVNMFAGLGNQMFQYAMGRRLAHALGVDLKLDISLFDRANKRRYELGNFQIQESFAFREEVQARRPRKYGIGIRALRKPFRMMAKLLLRKPERFICEKHFHFDRAMLALPDGVYLHGMWQSEKYFADVSGIIRREFVLKAPQNGKNKGIAEAIASTQSVSLHIRRGDYVTNARANRSHGVCSLDYYQTATQYIADRLADPHFFVFSDGPEWARDNLKLPRPTTFVDHNGPDCGWEDMRLMSQCRHHVIANSSFSWWGAWLNPRLDKIVCAPDQWFNPDYKRHRDTRDLLPADWVRL